MRGFFSPAPSWWLVCVLVAVAVAGNARADSLDEELSRALRKLPANAAISIYAAEVPGGEKMVGRDEGRLLMPASVHKLFTTYAALKVLEGAYRFSTELFVDRLPGEGAGDVGTLSIRGHGDPSLVNEALWQLAFELRGHGVRRVSKVVVDDTLFDIPQGRTGSEPYQAAQSAASLNFNSFAVTIYPGAPGKPPYTVTTPGIPIAVESSAVTVKTPAEKSTLTVSPPAWKENNRGTVRISGKIGAEAGAQTFYFPVQDPALYLGAAFRSMLQLHDIEVTGGVEAGRTAPGAVLLRKHLSHELTEILADLNRYSNNFIAGQLVYQLGAGEPPRYSFAKGLDVVRRTVVAAGIDEEGLNFADGSGLSRQNRASARQLVQVLLAAHRDFSIAPDFQASLSRYGHTGTLKKRTVPPLPKDGWDRSDAIWAKTGSLDGVSSLAGYGESLSGKKFAFAVIINAGVPKSDATEFEDALVKSLLKR